MSLPETAFFIKNDIVVGVGSCNIGMFFNLGNMWRCIWTAADSAMEYYLTDYEILTKINGIYRDGKDDTEILNNIKKRHTNHEKYFTTKEDLQQFDYLHIYHFKIPRSIINDVINKFVTEEEFVELLKTKIFNTEDSRQVKFKTKEEICE